MNANGRRVLSRSLLITVACGAAVMTDAVPVAAQIQTCTAQNVAAFPYNGTVCGGSVIDGCSPGAIYQCKGGPRGTTNNCTLAQSCSVGCLTGNSTPVTLNTQTPTANDACFAGATPLTFSPNPTAGGNYVNMTATLSQAHTGYAIVNLKGTGPLVPPVCNVPLFMPAGTSSVSFVEPTGVVNAVTPVPLWVLTSFIDAASGTGRNLVSVPSSLTLNSDGTLPAPSLLSFSVTDAGGTTISTIPGGSNAFTQGTLSASTPAPVGGTKVTVTSSPARAFVSDGSFVINAGCTTNSTWGVLTATSTLTSNLAATVSATVGASAALTRNVVVTPPALNIQSITLAPATVTGGGSLTATVTLNRAVLASDASSTVSVRVSEGIPSNVQVATFAGCTGTPACRGPLNVPVNASSASLTITTSAVSTQQSVTVTADAPWSNATGGAQLTINPATAAATTLSSLIMSPSSGTCGFSSLGTVTLTGAAPTGGAAVALSSSSTSNAQVPASVTVAQGQTQATFTATTGPTCSQSGALITAAYLGVSKQNALFFNAPTTCTPTTCAAQGKNCGTISDGCGGTLTCGTCTAPQTCGGGGIANVCGGGTTTTSTAQLTLTATGRSGESVSSSPAGLNVSVGTTGSFSFATGALVTLTVSNGRDAIWSGGCSSGGNKTKSCSLTMNAATSVSANVQ